MFRIILSIVSMILAAFALNYLTRDLIPPRDLILAAGAKGGGYWQYSERYAEILARDGIKVELIETLGSVQSAELLNDGSVDAAILQGGVDVGTGLEALGSIFYEPLFVFVRTDNPISKNPGLWEGLTLATGGEGSGTRAVIDALRQSAGVASDQNTLLPIGSADAALALLSDEVDAAIFVAPIDAPYLQPLFTSDRVRLLALDHIDALSSHLPHSNRVALAAGTLSLSPLVPPQDIQLLAMAARLVAQPNLHPSLVDRLVEAAREIHGQRDAITAENRFPSLLNVDMPMDSYASNLIRNGPNMLHAHLPYWVVAQVSRFAILILPVLFLLLPLIRTVPGIYEWHSRRRVYRHYDMIREIDEAARHMEDVAALQKLHDQLATIDAEIADLRLPLRFKEFSYTVRLHIDLLQKRISARIQKL